MVVETLFREPDESVVRLVTRRRQATGGPAACWERRGADRRRIDLGEIRWSRPRHVSITRSTTISAENTAVVSVARMRVSFPPLHTLVFSGAKSTAEGKVQPHTTAREWRGRSGCPENNSQWERAVEITRVTGGRPILAVRVRVVRGEVIPFAPASLLRHAPLRIGTGTCFKPSPVR